MTTAHRPTWHAALGGEGAGGNRLAVDSRKVGGRDLPGHRELKTRHDLPTEAEAAPGELKAQLLQSEAKRRTAIANKSLANKQTNNNRRLLKLSACAHFTAANLHTAPHTPHT
eukprot:GHVT01101271.1.p2 GENE.GHVT01101271.1~~GHVT01101271.1.p2  ORF type:complete len:113 (-),score=30.17 GHVT01101271.1:306-644(-)